MPGKEILTLELLSNDGTTLSFRATVDKAPPHAPLVACKVIATNPDTGDADFAEYQGLPTLLNDGDTSEFTLAAPPANYVDGYAYIWAWPNSTTPVSNTITL